MLALSVCTGIHFSYQQHHKRGNTMFDKMNTVWTENQYNAIREISYIMDITVEKAESIARELFARR